MKQHLQELIQQAIRRLKEERRLVEELINYEIKIERTKGAQHGDYASNVALTLSKKTGMKPRELADHIVKALPPSELVKKIEIAGPGFINFFVAHTAHHNVIEDVLARKENYGRANIGKGLPVHIEFVSANPTGPLHVGHGRGAAYGAAVSDLLEAMGYKVHREYYVNDAGRQMNILAISVWLRYLELFGENLVFPSNGYKGDYVVEIARQLDEEHGDIFKQSINKIFKDVPEDHTEKNPKGDKEAHIDGLIQNAKKLLGDQYKILHAFGMNNILDDIRDDLAEFGVRYQQWFSELELLESGAINKGIEALRKGDHLYEKDGALWFRSSNFGDEKDRVLVRENGQTTYFASDVAYHWNKLNRGFKEIIDVFGADHHGYVPRVKAAMFALGLNASMLKVPLVQFAILYRSGQRVQMSTRSGQFVTLRELREEVGSDAARFFYIMRKAEQHMDFDLDLAKSKSNENPVYYIQYAHARICSVFRQLKEKSLTFDQEQGLTSLEKLTEEHEKVLVRTIAKYSEVLVNATEKLEPHQLANYLRELAMAFHTYYNAHQFIQENAELRNARLCLIAATRQIFANGLQLLGVSVPEKM